MSWKPEVQVVNDDKWSDNAAAFKTEEEALQYATNLAARWTAVRNTRAVESEEEPNR